MQYYAIYKELSFSQFPVLTDQKKPAKPWTDRTGRRLRFETEITITDISALEEFYRHVLNLVSVLHSWFGLNNTVKL